MKQAFIISCFDWYKSRLMPVREVLIEHDYNVTVFIADFHHINKTPIEKKYPECTYIHVTHYKKNLSIKRIRSHLMFGREIGKRLNEIQPDLIFCQIPPNNVANYCRKYKEKKPDTYLFLDIIDLWPESMPIGKVRDVVYFWKQWRNKAIQSANHVYTECDLYKEKLGLNPEKTSTLYLFKEQTNEEKELVREIIETGKKDNIIRFAYLGSMNNIIDIEGICRVIRRFINYGNPCEFHAIGDGESRGQFENEIRNLGCDVHFYGTIFDEIEKIHILAPCNYAFNMMKGNISVGLTIKSIDYLSYGLPLINNIKGDTWRLIESKKLGVNVETGATFDLLEFDHKSILESYQRVFTKDSFSKEIRKHIK